MSLALSCSLIAGVTVAQESEEEAGSGRLEYDRMRFSDPVTHSVPGNIHALELQFASRISRAAFKNGGAKTQGVDCAARGPASIGARTNAIGIDIANENIILAGGTTGGMWRSTDRGSSWVRTTPLSVLPSTSCLAQDTRTGKTSTWYYGTGEFPAGNTGAYPLWLNEGFHKWGDYYGNGIFKSTDDGLTWNVLPSTAGNTIGSLVQPFNFVSRIVIDRSNSSQDIVYAAVPGGVERSSDGGTTWKLVLGNFPDDAACSDVSITSTGVVYAVISSNLRWKAILGDTAIPAQSTEGGIYRSEDGIHWVNISPLAWRRTYWLSLVAAAPSNKNVVYFAFDSVRSYGTTMSELKGCLWKYTYRSGDGSGAGGTFEDFSDGMPPVYGVLSVKPDEENTLFYGGLWLDRSTDGFASGLNITRLYVPHVDMNSISYFPSNPAAMIVGCDGGLFLTKNNSAKTVEWTDLNNGYITTQFYTVAIDHATSGDMTIIGGLQDNGTILTRSPNAKQPWTKVMGNDGATCAIADDGKSFYVSAQYGLTYRAVFDDTGSRTSFSRIEPIGSTKYVFINPFCLDPTNTNRMYFGGGSFLWRNDDVTAIPLGGNEATSVGWIKLARTSLLPIDSIIHTPMITAITSARTPASRVYYGTSDGRLFRIDSANTADPYPRAIWEGKGFPKLAFVSSIVTDSRNSDNAIVAFANYNVQSLFFTSDGGITWTPIGGNLEEQADGSGSGPSFRTAAMMHSGDGMIYLVGTSTGLYSTASLNGMSTNWTLEGSATIGNNIVNALDTRESDGMVAVATCGQGMFSGNFPPALSAKKETDLSASVIELSPNPTNGIITVRNAPENLVSVSVMNVLGEKVLELANPHSADFALDLSHLPAGIYFARFAAANSVVMRKIIRQ